MPYKDPEKNRAHKRARYLATKEIVKKRVKQWAAANSEKVAAIQKAWREAHPERRREHKAKWDKENMEYLRAKAATARARKIKAVPCFFGEFDRFVLHEAAQLAAKREKTTGFPWHVDHIIPFHGKKVSGLHVGLNLQVIPRSENMRKNNQFVVA